METRYVKWDSKELVRLIEILLDKLSDESNYVSKASE